MALAKAMGTASARVFALRYINPRKLMTAYTNAATRYGHALSRCDFKEVNRQAARLSKLYLAIRSQPHDSRVEMLLPLLNHIQLGVRLWAAAHALEFAPQLAEPVLHRLMNAKGLASQIAAATLRDWHSGDFRLA